MAAMKPTVPAAGRRRFLAGALLLLGGCGGAAIAPGPATDGASRKRAALVPVRGLLGARIALATDAAGAPLPRAYGPYRPFIFPVAVAAGPLDIFIADAGSGQLYRYDRTLDAMAVMPGHAGHDTRLQAARDGSVYVLDAIGPAIRRYDRAGRPLPSLLPATQTSSYREFVVDAVTGRGFAVDVANQRVDRIEPPGRLSVPDFDHQLAAPLAYADGSLFVGDVGCRCVVEYRDGKPLRQLAPGELRHPKALAFDRGTLYALDAFDRSICIVHPGGVERMLPAELGLLAPEAIAAADGLLYVADGAGHAIAVFRRIGGKP